MHTSVVLRHAKHFYQRSTQAVSPYLGAVTATDAGLLAALLPTVFVAKAMKRYRLAGKVTVYCLSTPADPGTKVKRSCTRGRKFLAYD